MKRARLTILSAIVVTCATGSAHAQEALSLQNFRQFAVFQQTIDLQGFDQDLLEATVFLVTNEERMARDLPLLPYHPLLGQAARGHARRMAEHGFFDHTDHTDPGRRTPSQRARKAGIDNPMTAENIFDFIGLQYDGSAVYPLPGQGRFSYTPDGPAIPMHSYLSFADAIVAGWMASPGHRANILHREARQLGVGIEPYISDGWPYFKAVQLFQLYDDALPAYSPEVAESTDSREAAEPPAAASKEERALTPEPESGIGTPVDEPEELVPEDGIPDEPPGCSLET